MICSEKRNQALQSVSDPMKYKQWAYQVPLKEWPFLLRKLHPTNQAPLVVAHEYEFEIPPHKGVSGMVTVGQYNGSFLLTAGMSHAQCSQLSLGTFCPIQDREPRVNFETQQDEIHGSDLEDEHSAPGTPDHPLTRATPVAPVKRSGSVKRPKVIEEE